MGLFSSSSNKKHIELICDIGNRSVGVALVEYESSEKPPKIIFNDRVSSQSKRDKDFENSIAVLSTDLNTLLNSALTNCVAKGIKPNRISCFYSSPWFISQNHILKLKQADSMVFSEHILNKILMESEQQFLNSEKDKISPDLVKNLKLIEKRVTSIKLNGYKTHKPFGKKAFDAEISVFLSAVLGQTISLVHDSVKRIWRGVNINHHTFPIASFTMLRNTQITFESYLLVNIANDITDVSLIHNEILTDTASFPFGYENVIQSLGESLNLEYGAASSALSMYIKNETQAEHAENLDGVIKTIEKDWSTHFENVCSTLMKNSIIPPVVYIICNEKISPFFESIIREFGFGGQIAPDKELKIFNVNNLAFDKYISYEESKNADLVLEIEDLYLNVISSSDVKIRSNYILE